MGATIDYLLNVYFGPLMILIILAAIFQKAKDVPAIIVAIVILIAYPAWIWRLGFWPSTAASWDSVWLVVMTIIAVLIFLVLWGMFSPDEDRYAADRPFRGG